VRTFLHDMDGAVDVARRAIRDKSPETALYLLSGPGQLRGRRIRDEVRSGLGELLLRFNQKRRSAANSVDYPDPGSFALSARVAQLLDPDAQVISSRGAVTNFRV